MYYIRFDNDNLPQYLYNWRRAVFLPDYARGFGTYKAACKYMTNRRAAIERNWCIVQIADTTKKC